MNYRMQSPSKVQAAYFKYVLVYKTHAVFVYQYMICWIARDNRDEASKPELVLTPRTKTRQLQDAIESNADSALLTGTVLQGRSKYCDDAVVLQLQDMTIILRATLI
mmetsp:Transcript_22296/g.62087  ORF Transcript_22296/g.62087 Transcript_22296/m.62087 type:complete len:107 (+) Transcript_22296:366-686(+)